VGDKHRRWVEGGHRHRIRGHGHGVGVPLAAARATEATSRGAHRDGYSRRGHSAHVHLMLLHLKHLHLVDVRRSIRHWHRRVRVGMCVRVVVRRWGASVEDVG